ncbi:lysozyme inhibitor LprI family protein [Aminomonas paucivorans]|uniref:lysozyme inhibitor LprI family protein n=1 Tax=Aminomonas paucivorans TaxID=81412 RepID=UPI003325806E
MRPRIAFGALILLGLLLGTAWGAPKVHPIDGAYQKDLARDSSTAGTVEASNRAAAKWDRELNRVYKALMAQTGPEARQKLQASQRRWLAYRDAERTAVGAMAGDLYEQNGGGTLWGMVAAVRSMEILRARALELTEYLDLYTGP